MNSAISQGRAWRGGRWPVLPRSGRAAQSAEPTYKADPSVYKMIFEDANFRVIDGESGRSGVKDKRMAIRCRRIYIVPTASRSCTPPIGGRATRQAGTARRRSPRPSAENVGSAICKPAIVEKM